MRGASSSARPDSLIPQVRTTRLVITAASPATSARPAQVGEHGPGEHLDSS